VASQRGVVAGRDITGTVITGDIAGDVTIQHAPAPEIPPPPAPTRPPELVDFVGRETELSYFAEKLKTEHMAVISGMAGIGKTTMAAALIRRTADPYRTFWHSFHEGEGIDVIIWKLAGFLAWQGQVDLWQMLQSARLTGGQPPPPEALFDYLLQTVRGQSYLLCFDDLQFVDEDPLLGQFVNRLHEARVAGDLSMIITSRRLPAFVKTLEFEPLEGLTPEDTRRLLIAREIVLIDDLVEDLYTHTGGNAQFLTLAIDALKWAMDPDQLVGRLAEADDIERYLLNEVDGRLTRDERAVMSAVAVLLSYPGTRDVIEAVLNAGSVMRTLRELSDRHLLIVSEGEAGREYIQHSMVQAFYYETLGRRQRREMHRRAGEYYDLEQPDVFQAALHYERGGEYERAAHLATEGVSALINQGLVRPLRRLLERFDARQLGTEQWAKVCVGRGQVHAFLGDGQAARDSYAESLSQLATMPETPTVRELRARTCRGMGELLEDKAPQEALDWLRRGLDKLAGDGDTEEAGLHIKAGQIHMRVGSFSDALDVLQRGLEQLPEEPSQLRATALMNLGAVYFYQGDTERAKAYSQNALEISRQLHDYFQTAQILNNSGMIRYASGDWTGGIADFQQALAMAKRLGSEGNRNRIELNIGIAYAHTGDDETALNHLANSLNLARKINDRLIEIAAQGGLADLRIRLGEWEAAELALREAERLALEVGVKQVLPEIYSCWAELKLATGQEQAALDYSQRSIGLAREGNMDVQQGISLRVMGQILLASGQRGPALAAFEESLPLLDGQDSYEAARTKAQWGLALLHSANSDQGVILLKEARSAFQELGARRDVADLEGILQP
jgi:ATP/maltotriose-dependent transcriptional regulator MalT